MFHPVMKFTCQQFFFIPERVSFWDEISSRLHVSTVLDPHFALKVESIQSK